MSIPKQILLFVDIFYHIEQKNSHTRHTPSMMIRCLRVRSICGLLLITTRYEGGIFEFSVT